MEAPITIILASHQMTERERLRKLLAGQRDIQVVGEVQNDQECLALVLRQRPQVLIIQDDIPTQGGLNLARQIIEKSSDIGVILMMNHSTGEEIWHKMLQSGVHDFISRNTADDRVVEMIHHVAAARQTATTNSAAEEQISKNRIIAVTAPRNGTGKTVIATNLAVTLAKKQDKVMLLDLNLVNGDVAVLLDLVPQRTMVDLMTSYAGVDDDMMESLTVLHRSGLYVLPAPVGANYDSTGLSRSVVQHVLQFIRNKYIFTIADCGQPSSEGTLAAMDSADIILVVVGNDLPRLRDAKQYLKNLVDGNYSKERIRVVVNRSGIGKAINEKEAESLLEFPVTAHLSNDDELVSESVNMGQPFVVASPNKPLSRELLKLADNLSDVVEVVPKKSKSIFGMFL